MVAVVSRHAVAMAPARSRRMDIRVQSGQAKDV